MVIEGTGAPAKPDMTVIILVDASTIRKCSRKSF
jgi:hypothetical protein